MDAVSPSVALTFLGLFLAPGQRNLCEKANEQVWDRFNQAKLVLICLVSGPKQRKLLRRLKRLQQWLDWRNWKSTGRAWTAAKQLFSPPTVMSTCSIGTGGRRTRLTNVLFYDHNPLAVDPVLVPILRRSKVKIPSEHLEHLKKGMAVSGSRMTGSWQHCCQLWHMRTMTLLLLCVCCPQPHISGLLLPRPATSNGFWRRTGLVVLLWETSVCS